MKLGGASSSQNMRFWGLGSGLDVDDIVGKLMSVERIPLERLHQRRQLLLWQQEEYRAINLKMRELSEAALSLRLGSSFTPSRVTSSHEEIVGAAVAAGAPEGTYSLSVEQLADSLHVYSASIDAGATLKEQFPTIADTISFQIEKVAGDGEEVLASQTFTFSTATASLHDVVKAINAQQEELELEALYDAGLGRFFLSGKKTGSELGYRLVDAAGDLLSTRLGLQYRDEAGTERSAVGEGAVVTGRDAIFTLNGANGLRAASNSVSISSVTFSLKQVSSQPVSIQVQRDVERAVGVIKDFIEKYNAFVDSLNSKLAEKRHYKYQPLTDAQKEELSEKEIAEWQEKARSGLLRSDPLLTRVLTDLRGALTRPVEGADSPYGMLFQIGITTGSWYEGGKLRVVDESKLRTALAQDPEGVAALFTQQGTDAGSTGIGLRFGDALSAGVAALRTRAGVAEAPVDSSPLGRQMKLLDEQIEIMEARLQRRETAYFRQFVTMESFMSQANAQSMWLSQQFGGWS
jgi:flagellar hook-associated protein 2